MKNKRVVYTCLTGGYDCLVQHEYVDPDYDYICFSNDFNVDCVGHWKIRKIDFETCDLQLLSRYPKLQPHKMLQDYEESIYVDANIMIKDDTLFRRVKELSSQRILLAGMKHQLRQCLYEESLFLMLEFRSKNNRLMIEQMRKYKKEGFPRRFGMYEANVIYRKHNETLVVSVDDEWWFQRKNYSHRDQLSFSYALWKYSVPWNYLLPETFWARNHPGFACPMHPGKKRTGIRRLLNIYFKYLIPVLHRFMFPFYYKMVL